MRHQASTRPFRAPAGETLPGSIAEAGYQSLGGLDQWVMIRGEDVGNPPLVLLHGGPGFSETTLFRHFNAPLEQYFTVVYWDQRGAGKSFRTDIPRSSMTVEQFIADLDQLVNHVRTRVGQERVVLFGHSWGSALGVLYAARFPQKVSAYVGSGQVGDWAQGEALSYAFALAEATRQRAWNILKRLQAIGPPPHDTNGVFTERTCLQWLDGQLRPRALWNLGRVILGDRESSLFDLPSAMRGFRFSVDAMWPDVSKLNLLTLVPELQVPVFFLLGRRDHWVPPETSVAYFNGLSAPSKTLVWFEQSGHEPFMDEPDRFNREMIRIARLTTGPAPLMR